MEILDQHLPIGSRVDRYRIEKILGIGGFGVTYLATDTQLDYPVAIKEFMPDDCAIRSPSNSQILAKTNRQDDYQYGLDRFLDEAKTLAKFKHSNIVRVTNFLVENNTAYLVMEYEEGEALDDKLKRNSFKGQMPEAEILAIFKPILKGLEKVHQQGLLHRDIKPGNIYLRQDGEPMLIDFGAARYALGAQSKSISAIISMGYAPPEQYSSRGKQGPYSDLYGLGATIYQLMSGKAPAESPERTAANMDDEQDPMIPASKLAGAYSAHLCQTIDWCLQLSGKQRPQSAAEVLKALEEGVPANDEAITASGTRRVKEGGNFSKKSQPKKQNKTASKSSSESRSKFRWAPIAIAGAMTFAGGYWWLQQAEAPTPVKPDINNLSSKPQLLAVTIRANIANTKIYIDGQGYYQPGQKLLPGTYAVIAVAEGYTSLQQKIEVGPGKTFFQLELKKLPAVLYPLTIANSPTGASIQVLNIDPDYQAGMKLPAGEYRIKVSKPGYSSKTEAINLSQQQQRFSIALIKLKPQYRAGQIIQDSLSSGGKGPELVVLPKGSFQMGCVSGKSCKSTEKPVHRVTIDHRIAMMKYEVTFADYDKYSNANGRSRVSDKGWGRDNRPALDTSWKAANAYAKWLSQQTGKIYRLPSEAEWEYGARAGTNTPFSTGNCINTNQANYSGSYDFENCRAKTNIPRTWTMKVGSFSANNFGLYDMHGNVKEWVADCWHANYQDAPSNGKVWSSKDCEFRVMRGGSWGLDPIYLRSAHRNRVHPRYKNDLSVGFRLVQDLNP